MQFNLHFLWEQIPLPAPKADNFSMKRQEAAQAFKKKKKASQIWSIHLLSYT